MTTNCPTGQNPRRPAQQGHRPPSQTATAGRQRACQQTCPRAARPPTNCNGVQPETTGTSTTLSKNCTTPPATTTDPHTIREPTLELPGAALNDVMMTVVSLCTGLWGPRVRGSLSRRRRHRTDKSSGQQLPRECRPSSDPARRTCRPLGPPATVTPFRLLASPSGANLTGTKRLHHVVVVVEWLYYS